MTIEEFINEVAADDQVLLADGLDAAFIGLTFNSNNEQVAVYSKDRVIEVLMLRDGMGYYDALEFFEFNIAQAFVGPRTPIYVSTINTGSSMLKEVSEMKDLLKSSFESLKALRTYGYDAPQVENSAISNAEGLIEKLKKYTEDI